MARVITAPGIVRNVSKYLNSMRRVPFAIGKDDWTEVDSSTYTYEFVTAYVTTSSFDIGTFDNSVRSYAKGDINMEKKDGGGGMVFTTTKRPTGTVSGSIYIWDNNDNKVPVILEDTVIPIENGGTEATSVPGILSNLGLGSANDAQETLDFGDAVHKDVANNVTTTSEGYLLDARQGKVLKDSVDALNGNFACGTVSNVASLDALKTLLSTIVSGMQITTHKNIIFNLTAVFDPFTTGGLWLASIFKYTNSYFSALVHSYETNGLKLIKNKNGAWTIEEYAQNSKMATTEGTFTPVSNITMITSDYSSHIQKSGNVVTISLAFYGSNITADQWTGIGTISAGFRPKYKTMVQIAVLGASHTPGDVYSGLIETDGTVRMFTKDLTNIPGRALISVSYCI